MKKLFTISLLGLLSVVTSCQKELDEEDVIFRGDWSSSDYALQIFQNGYGVCNGKKLGFPFYCEGRVKIKGDKLVFISNTEESTRARKKFDIDQRPSIDPSGVTYMVLDGDRFERH